jgi:hypothetical protein
MNKFDLTDGKFYSYNNRTISSDKPLSLTGSNEYTFLRHVAWKILRKNEKPKLSFMYKINRYFTHFKWADKHFTSGNGKINDSKFFVDELVHHISKFIELTYFSSSEVRELLMSGIRVYTRDSGAVIQIKDLRRCVNLQEFYSDELKIDFDFADNLENLRIVDLYVNNANNKYGNLSEMVIREVIHVDKLKSCVVLYLMDSHLREFNKIPKNILALSLRNSNFENLQHLMHLSNIEYLDISYTNIRSTLGLSQLRSLKILNICCVKLNDTAEIKSIYQEILNLEDLEILIIDTENLNSIFGNKSITFSLKSKILELPNEYNVGYISSLKMVDALKISERIKIENDESTSDFWNTPMGEGEDYKTNEVKVDYGNIKELLFKSRLNRRNV